MVDRRKLESNAKHNAKLEQIAIRFPKGTKDLWKAEAARRGLSLARFVSDAVTEKIERERDQTFQEPEK